LPHLYFPSRSYTQPTEPFTSEEQDQEGEVLERNSGLGALAALAEFPSKHVLGSQLSGTAVPTGAYTSPGSVVIHTHTLTYTLTHTYIHTNTHLYIHKHTLIHT